VNTSDSCLEAETLAAWTDGGLTRAELRTAQSHVADCARCQALVGAMARTGTAVPSLEAQPARRRWLAWAVPLTAAATALVIWTTAPRNASTPVPAVAIAPQPERSRGSEPPAPAPVPETSSRKAQPTAPAAAPPSVTTTARRDAPAAQAPETRELRDESKAADGAPAAPPQESSKDVAAAAPQPFSTAAAARVQAANIAAPSPSIQDLCGASWTSAPPAVTTQLVAGSSPSANVCWIVGRLGVVLLTTDARTWRGISFPVMTDLSAVIAVDARTATVTAADGRVFATTDGGSTWMTR
jgi:hypothetical protein